MKYARMEIKKRTENFEYVKIVNIWNDVKIVYKEIETETIDNWIEQMNKEIGDNQDEPLTKKDYEVDYYCENCREIEEDCRCTEYG